MPIASVVELVGEIHRLQLLSSAQRTELDTALAPNTPEPKKLAAELIKRGWLTPFQVNHLFQGKTAELILGPYVLMERVGEGGMGQVFKAMHSVLRRIDALKTIRLGLQPGRPSDILDRFKQEAMAAGRASHANLVAVHTAEARGDIFYLAMEFIDGVDMGRLMATNPAGLPVSQACDHIRQAAVGLQHAHSNGLVHRDIKPSNLMVTRDGVVKVLDLGLAFIRTAEQANTRLTRPGAMMGTPDYMPPEQFNDAQNVDHRADIYALGCTLYHLLTGKPPFPEGSVLEKMRHHCDHEAIPLREKRPEIPEELASLVHRMMAKEMEGRPQSAEEVVRGLLPFCPSFSTIPVAVPVAMELGERRGVSPPVMKGDSSVVPEDRRAHASPPAQAPTDTGLNDESMPWPPSQERTIPLPAEKPNRKFALLAGGGVAALALLFLVIKLAGGGKANPIDDNDKRDDGSAVKDDTRKTTEEEKPTLVVDPNGSGPRTILAALSQAKPGMRIRIRPGTYTQPLQLHMNLELVGDGKPGEVVIESKSTDSVVILTESVTLRGLTILYKGGPDKECHAVDASQGHVLLEDCVIESDAWACMVARQPGERATLRRCTLRSLNTGGLLIVQGAQATLEDCVLTGKEKAALEVQQQSKVTARRCKIQDGEKNGVLVIDDAEAILEECHAFRNKTSNVVFLGQCTVTMQGCQLYESESFGLLCESVGKVELTGCDIHSNAKAGVKLTKGSNPTLRKCRLHDGVGGLSCDKNAEGLLDDCEIFGHNKGEVQILEGGNPRLKNCRIYSGKAVGVVSSKKGKGVLEDCELYGHKEVAVLALSEADLTCLRCKIHDGQNVGVQSETKGRVTLDRCEVYGNANGGVAVAKNAFMTIRGGRVAKNNFHGITLEETAEIDVEGCDLRGNALGPWAGVQKAKVRNVNNQER